MLKIVTAPNPILSQKAKPCAVRGSTSRYAPVPNRMVLGRYGAKSVAKIDAGILNLIEGMKQVLLSAKDPEGVGLAAPQVGKPLQIFLAKPSDKSDFMVFVNPEIITQSSKVDYVKRPKKDASEKASRKLEGCLSLPAIWGPVLRSSSVTLSYLDEHGKSHKKKFSNFLATIIQHEIDHLNGILFPKRVLEQKGKLYKSHKDEKSEDVFEEIEI